MAAYFHEAISEAESMLRDAANSRDLTKAQRDAKIKSASLLAGLAGSASNVAGGSGIPDGGGGGGGIPPALPQPEIPSVANQPLANGNPYQTANPQPSQPSQPQSALPQYPNAPFATTDQNGFNLFGI
jgi:hypothetical protein